MRNGYRLCKGNFINEESTVSYLTGTFSMTLALSNPETSEIADGKMIKVRPQILQHG